MIDRTTGEPLTIQLERTLIEKIESGEWAENTLIPSETALCKMYDVSRTTVRWALLRLETAGLIQKLRGKGSIVVPQKKIGKISYFGIREQINRSSWHGRSIVLTHGICPAPKYAARRLNIALGDEVLYLERLHLEASSGEPHMLQRSFLKKEFAAFIDFSQPQVESVANLLAAHGIVCAYANEWIEASTATRDEAQKLEVPNNAAVLIIDEQRFDAEDRPYYFTRMITRGDKLRLEFTTKE